MSTYRDIDSVDITYPDPPLSSPSGSSVSASGAFNVPVYKDSISEDDLNKYPEFYTDPAVVGEINRNGIKINGDSSTSDVNISSSDLNATKTTLDNMSQEQQSNNYSWFKDFYDYIVEQTDKYNQLSKDRTDDARRYSEYVYKNQAKWYVDGLKKAGINPLMIAHGLSPTPFTSMGSAQVFSPDTPTTEYANTVNTQINALVSLLQHAQRLDFDERVAYLQHNLGLNEIDAKKYAAEISFGSGLLSGILKFFGS